MCPLYEFRCTSCGEIEEHVLSYQEVDTAKLQCEKCGGEMARQIAGGKSILNGPGFTKGNYCPKPRVKGKKV